MLFFKEQIKALDDKKKAAVLTSLMLITFLLVFHPEFESNDDNAIAAISAGMRGNYNSHLVFVNILLGKIIKIFMNFLPAVKWYVVFQYFFLCLGFAVIFYSVLKLFQSNSAAAYLIIGILILFWGYECFIKLQFSKTSGICGAAGSFLIFTSLKEEEKNWIEIILGGILLLLCSMLRLSVFELVIILSAVIGFALFKNKLKKREGKAIYFCIGTFALITALGIGLSVIDIKIYDSQTEWRKYREYNHLRAELLDRGFPDYLENTEKYAELGITETDILNWTSWNFADKEAFTTETMKAIIAMKNKRKFSLNFFGEFFTEFFTKFLGAFFQERCFLGLSLLLVLWFIYFRKNRSGIFVLMAVILGLNLYFYYKGRYLVNRIDTIIWLMSGLSLIYFMSEESGCINADSKSIRFFLISIVVLNLNAYWLNLTKNVNPQEKINAKEYLNMISQDNNRLYLVSVGSSPENMAYGIFDLPKKGLLNNYYSLGGWQTNSPITNTVLKKYSVKNPYRDVVDNPDIYLVDNYYIDIKLAYIRQRYAENAYAALVKNIFGNRIYRVITKPPALETENIMKADPKLKNAFNCQVVDNTIQINGFAYIEGIDSWKEEFYTIIINQETGEEKYYFSTQKELDGITEPCLERYAGFETIINKYDLSAGSYLVRQILKLENKLYEAGIGELQIQ